jgi:hemoglobin-like flavoprotein
MTTNQITIIRSTFRSVARSSDIAAQLFYQRLFELDPSLRPLFRSNLDEQGAKLMQMLGAAVGLLDKPGSLIPVLENLGRRHTGYGVRDEHYDTVGKALLDTLDNALGSEFTPEAREAWTALYTVVATTMKAAAQPAMA